MVPSPESETRAAYVSLRHEADVKALCTNQAWRVPGAEAWAPPFALRDVIPRHAAVQTISTRLIESPLGAADEHHFAPMNSAFAEW